MFLELGEGVKDPGPVETFASFAPPSEKGGNWYRSPSVAPSGGPVMVVVGGRG